uniref:Uncharacterized protein n=1 Tax=Medicago truncatula TaxID=3880 RepID=I3S5M3_MEDTR|nr:unknown [Medicago truncatula]
MQFDETILDPRSEEELLGSPICSATVTLSSSTSSSSSS